MADSNRGKRVVVTGGLGFVGSHLCNYLDDQGCDLSVIDKKLEGKDMRDFDMLSAELKRLNPDIVFHLAAITQVVEGLEDPRTCFVNNIDSTVNLMECAREMKFKVVHMSTDKVYGEGLDKTERSELDPIYPYDVSKLCAEQVVRGYSQTYQLSSVIVRSCNIYGENDPNSERIVPSLIKSVRNGKLLKLRSDGKSSRDYIYVKDAVKAIHLISKQQSGIYNVSSGENMSVLEMIEKFEKATNIKVQYKIESSSDREIKRQSVDDSKLRKLGWKPRYKFSDIIKTIYEKG